MSVISISEVAFERFEVDSLVDSAQTWHVDTPRASGVRVPANFPQTAISVGISVSTRPILMSCLDDTGRHRKWKCSSSACALRKFATDILGWTAVCNIGSIASLRAQAQVRFGNPEFGLDSHFTRKISIDPQIAENLPSCLPISIHWTCLTSVWRAGSLDFWTGIQVEIQTRWVVYLTIIKCFRLLYIATIHQIINKIRVIDQTGIFEIEVSAEQKWAFLICGCF